MFSDKEEKVVEAEKVELNAGEVGWTGFGSSKWPFLQQETAEKATNRKRC